MSAPEARLSTIILFYIFDFMKLGILGGYAVIAIVGVIAWQVTDKRMHLSRAQQGAVVLGAVLANTGYLGLPVARTLLAEHEFPQSVAWDSLISQPMALLIAPGPASVDRASIEDRGRSG